MQHQGGSWAATLLPFVIIAAVLALRFRSMSKERPLKLQSLWVVPAIYLFLAGSMLVALPPPPAGWVRDYVFIGDGWIRMATITRLFPRPCCLCRITRSRNTRRLRANSKMNGFTKSILTTGRNITRAT